MDDETFARFATALNNLGAAAVHAGSSMERARCLFRQAQRMFRPEHGLRAQQYRKLRVIKGGKD
jgi:hypothetical protein